MYRLEWAHSKSSIKLTLYFFFFAHLPGSYLFLKIMEVVVYQAVQRGREWACMKSTAGMASQRGRDLLLKAGLLWWSCGSSLPSVTWPLGFSVQRQFHNPWDEFWPREHCGGLPVLHIFMLDTFILTHVNISVPYLA